jgi:hypothetical protein
LVIKGTSLPTTISASSLSKVTMEDLKKENQNNGNGGE